MGVTAGVQFLGSGSCFWVLVCLHLLECNMDFQLQPWGTILFLRAVAILAGRHRLDPLTYIKNGVPSTTLVWRQQSAGVLI